MHDALPSPARAKRGAALGAKPSHTAGRIEASVRGPSHRDHGRLEEARRPTKDEEEQPKIGLASHSRRSAGGVALHAPINKPTPVKVKALAEKANVNIVNIIQYRYRSFFEPKHRKDSYISGTQPESPDFFQRAGASRAAGLGRSDNKKAARWPNGRGGGGNIFSCSCVSDRAPFDFANSTARLQRLGSAAGTATPANLIVYASDIYCIREYLQFNCGGCLDGVDASPGAMSSQIVVGS
ncbi:MULTISPECIES: hypothetical protein [Methylobacterium]|uniref:hypothetical protein n=1 Tax=Methylobacterium TaxID=407 RepID=UPI000B0B5838|nr:MULTISPECIES: hypothetical protein [Methylobacterium]RUP14097.1 MAG: hypothetical protein EKK43_13445 [Methylobacterium sp.]